MVGLGGLRERLALALLEDVQTLPQAAERGRRGGFEQQQVLVQAGHRSLGGQRVDGVDQVLLLALGLGHHLRRGTRRDYSQGTTMAFFHHCAS